MIQKTTTHVCHVCKSTHIVKNGKNRCGNAQYHCKDCGAYRVLKPKQVYTETEQQPVLRAYLERCSLRGIARIFAMTRQTIARWFKAYAQSFPQVPETLLPATPDDVLELDEIWSFVQKKEQTRWVWTAMCRRTRQIVAFVVGDRSKTTCLRLWQTIPEAYQHCHPFSDFWFAPIGPFSRLGLIAGRYGKGATLVFSRGVAVPVAVHEAKNGLNAVPPGYFTRLGR